MTGLRPQGGRRTLALIRDIPGPPSCQVCDDTGVVAVVRLVEPDVAGGGRARCPHCKAVPGEMPLPIFIFPMRDETPKDVA